jgi:hypothetical protein
MGVDDLALPHIRFGKARDFVPYQFMKARDAYPGLPFMLILVKIAYFIEIIAVIENADPEYIQQIILHPLSKAGGPDKVNRPVGTERGNPTTKGAKGGGGYPVTTRYGHSRTG